MLRDIYVLEEEVFILDGWNVRKRRKIKVNYFGGLLGSAGKHSRHSKLTLCF